MFVDRNIKRVTFTTEELKGIKEYQEPYSKEFYVLVDIDSDKHEGDEIQVDELTNRFTDGNIYDDLDQAKKALKSKRGHWSPSIKKCTTIKKFRITEVPIDGGDS